MIHLRYDEKGLIPVIVQDVNSGEVLMMAYMNKEALENTIKTGYTHFYSRSRKRLWKKGETSGHLQAVRQILVDCDSDALLVKVVQHGPGACHTGHRSCFYRDINGKEVSQKVFSEEDVYGRDTN